MIVITILIIPLVFLLYKHATKNYSYWKDIGIPYLKPLPFVGNFLPVFMFQISIGDYLQKLYNESKVPYFGVFIFNKPFLVINTPDVIKSVLITDFNYFCDRNLLGDEEADPISACFLPMLNNPEWRAMRAKLTPAFTAAKMKNMVGLMVNVANDLVEYIDQNLCKDSVNVADISMRFSTDVIATCAFGLNAQCFKNENSEFRMIAKRCFDFSLRNSFTQTCYFVAPDIVKWLKLSFFDKVTIDFARRVFWGTLNERKIKNIKRNDLVDILNSIRETGDDPEFDGDRVLGQALVFFAAGLETAGNALAYTLYELCLNPDIQDKLRTEINTILVKHGELTYEALQDMTYMNTVIYETLRKYPILPFIDRISVKDYILPNTCITIKKGTAVLIPSLGLQRDPKYYPNPETFSPERFLNKNNMDVCYLPFGKGPRTCLGERFAMMELKVALTRILSKFEAAKSLSTPERIEFSKTAFLLHPKGGLSIQFKKLK